jgi:hypothetical protein
LTGRVDRHRCGDWTVNGSALSTAAATVPAVIFVTARSTTRTHRVIAHGPHSTGSGSEITVQESVRVVVVAAPFAIVISPMVSVAKTWYGIPASCDSTSRHRSRRPNMPCVHPWEGRPRSAAAT